MTNYYKVLGIHNFATEAEVKLAYRSLAKKYHPDLNVGNKEYEEKLKEINKAYNCLCDPEFKQSFDEKLREQRSFQATKIPIRKKKQKKAASKRTSAYTYTNYQKPINPTKGVGRKSAYPKTLIIVFLLFINIAIGYVLKTRNKAEKVVKNEESSINTLALLGPNREAPERVKYNIMRIKSMNDAVYKNYDKLRFLGHFSDKEDEFLNLQSKLGDPILYTPLEDEGYRIYSYEDGTLIIDNFRFDESFVYIRRE